MFKNSERKFSFSVTEVNLQRSLFLFSILINKGKPPNSPSISGDEKPCSVNLNFPFSFSIKRGTAPKVSSENFNEPLNFIFCFESDNGKEKDNFKSKGPRPSKAASRYFNSAFKGL